MKRAETGYYIVAEIVNIVCNEDYLAEDGKPDLEKMHLITFDLIHNGYFQLVKRVGNAFCIGNHLPTQNLEKILFSTLWGVVAPLISVRLKSTWRRSRLTISALCLEVMPSITFVMFIEACDNAS